MLRYIIMFIVLTATNYFIIDLIFVQSIQISVLVIIFMILMDLYEKKKKS